MKRYIWLGTLFLGVFMGMILMLGMVSAVKMFQPTNEITVIQKKSSAAYIFETAKEMFDKLKEKSF